MDVSGTRIKIENDKIGITEDNTISRTKINESPELLHGQKQGEIYI